MSFKGVPSAPTQSTKSTPDHQPKKQLAKYDRRRPTPPPAAPPSSWPPPAATKCVDDPLLPAAGNGMSNEIPFAEPLLLMEMICRERPALLQSSPRLIYVRTSSRMAHLRALDPRYFGAPSARLHLVE